MEEVLLKLGVELIPVFALVITGLATWGIAILKSKVDSEAGKQALDEIDQIVGTVVGKLAQTTARDLKKASKDGHLSKDEMVALKAEAVNKVRSLMSKQITKSSKKAINDLHLYIHDKIEEKVLAVKNQVK